MKSTDFKKCESVPVAAEICLTGINNYRESDKTCYRCNYQSGYFSVDSVFAASGEQGQLCAKPTPPTPAPSPAPAPPAPVPSSNKTTTIIIIIAAVVVVVVVVLVMMMRRAKSSNEVELKGSMISKN